MRLRVARAAGVHPARRGLAAIAIAAFSALGLLSGCAPAPPSVIAATGDSIARGFDACGLLSDCPSISYATGNDPRSASVYRQLLGGSPGLRGHQYNDAQVGARAEDLFGQMALASWQKADVVTVLVGGNDACTQTVGAMTPVSSFRASIDSALSFLFSQRPSARVVVSSIPNLYRVWQVAHTSPAAQSVWRWGICPTMLDRPTSTAPADNLRRVLVTLQIQKYNAVLGAVCHKYRNCRWDGGAVNRYPFRLAELSRFDYFHPNELGQRALARLTWHAYKS